MGKNHCDSCICKRLRKLASGTTVDVILSGLEFANLIFIGGCGDSENCCVEFADGNNPLILDCRKIEGFRVVVA
ncbi:hypothetical protein SAMN04488137_0960 [Fictibacillus solisalsi]|uniref:Uncharacterized protein n=1 Tax=Fictibacillus solisalsi TaxID=459525 RepID=A0A1G9UJB2_9BACL|nr:hypothetical protein [Fictibacillus solisalsi]SDM60022.1 hypothetical protein SAMN04488137_0960 [Fictibacillus solisalsi]